MGRSVQGILQGVILLSAIGLALGKGSAYGKERGTAAPLTVDIQRSYEQLAKGLKDEVSLLASIRDTVTAQQKSEPLRKMLEELRTQRKKVNEEDLWRYIDNTPNLKQPLTETLELLFLQLQRIHQKEYFGSVQLRRLLGTQLKPAVGKPVR